MRVKLFVISTILALAPLGAMAERCERGEQAAMTCMAGTLWDAEKQACVPVASS